MNRILAPFLWIYDFLAEDVTIMIGAVIAVILGVLVVHVNKSAAGYVLFAAVILAITVSIWRTATAR
jgi:hypothetical protein